MIPAKHGRFASGSFWILFLITLVGLLTRFWHIDYSLPEAHYADEIFSVYHALNMGGSGLNPHWFEHPTFYFYLCLAADAVFILCAFATGTFTHLGDAWTLYKTNPAVYFILARGVSAVMGAAAIPVTYAIGRRLSGRRTGMMAAVFLTFSLIHVQWSQVGYMDITVAFLMEVSFLFALAFFESGKLKYLLLAGFMGGLSGATKLTGLETLMFGPLAIVLSFYDSENKILKGTLWKKTLFFFLSFMMGFTLGMPFWILDFKEFWAQTVITWGWYRPGGTGQIGYEGQSHWASYLLHTLRYGLGWPVLVGGVLGIFSLLKTRAPKNIFFAVFPLVYFSIAGLATDHKASYLLPLVPFFCIGAAYFLTAVVKGGFKINSRLSMPSLFFLGVLIILPSMLSVFRFQTLKKEPDTRRSLIEWTKSHLSDSDHLLQSYYLMSQPNTDRPQIQPLDKGVMDTRLNNQSELKTLDDYKKEGYQYIMLDEWILGIVLEAAADKPRHQRTVAAYSGLMTELKHSAELVAFFTPYPSSEVPPYDVDNVMIPLHGLWQRRSLGPAIWVYKIGASQASNLEIQ